MISFGKIYNILSDETINTEIKRDFTIIGCRCNEAIVIPFLKNAEDPTWSAKIYLRKPELINIYISFIYI